MINDCIRSARQSIRSEVSLLRRLTFRLLLRIVEVSISVNSISEKKLVYDKIEYLEGCLLIHGDHD